MPSNKEGTMQIKKSVSAKTAPEDKKSKKKRVDAVPEMFRFSDEIQLQAYYNYLKRVRNNAPGSEVSDWLEAEEAIISQTDAR